MLDARCVPGTNSLKTKTMDLSSIFFLTLLSKRRDVMVSFPLVARFGSPQRFTQWASGGAEVGEKRESWRRFNGRVLWEGRWVDMSSPAQAFYQSAGKIMSFKGFLLGRQLLLGSRQSECLDFAGQNQILFGRGQ